MKPLFSWGFGPNDGKILDQKTEEWIACSILPRFLPLTTTEKSESQSRPIPAGSEPKLAPATGQVQDIITPSRPESKPVITHLSKGVEAEKVPEVFRGYGKKRR